MSGKITKEDFDDAFRKFTKMINNSTDDNIIKNIMEFGRFEEAGILQKMTTLTDKKNVEVANNKYGITTLIIIKMVKTAMNQMNYEGIKNLANDFLKKNNIQIKKIGGGGGDRYKTAEEHHNDVMMISEIFIGVGCIALFVIIAIGEWEEWGLWRGGKKHRKSKRKKSRKSKRKKRRKSKKRRRKT